MQELLWGVFLVSLPHAFFPLHWLPILATSKGILKTEKHANRLVWLGAGIHITSTLVVGMLVAWLGYQQSENIEPFIDIILPLVLVLLGIYTLWHFGSQHSDYKNNKGRKTIATGVAISMALMPCLEVEPFFLLGAVNGWKYVMLVSVIYTGATLIGVGVWWKLFNTGKLSEWWKKNEKKTGKFAGGILMLSGILIYFFGE